MKTAPYTPPPGRFDLPFTWAINTGGYANGSNALGQSIYLIGGFGDFVARRAVGMNRILAADGTGAFQINRSSRYDYLSADPIQAPNSPEIPIVNEQFYRETGQIRFDLYGIDQPANLLTSQIAFQGVRRQRGGAVQNPNYKAFPKTFTYQATANLPAAPAGVTKIQTQVNDYDFRLEQLIILAATSRSATLSSECGNYLLISPAGSNITATVNIIGGSGISQPASLVVSGNVITYTSATNSGGGDINDEGALAELVAAINGSAAASALVTLTQLLPGDICGFNVGTSSTVGSGVPGAITSPVCAITLYDWVNIATSNIPILDIFMDGGPGSPYENGALVPPLWYPNQSSIAVDFTPLTNAPVSVVVYFVGRQYYPCA